MPTDSGERIKTHARGESLQNRILKFWEIVWTTTYLYKSTAPIQSVHFCRLFLIKALTVKCSYRLTKIKLFFRFINSFCDCIFGFIEWALQIREVVWLSMMVCDRVRRSDPSSLSNISETSFYQCKHILDRFRIIHFPSTIASYIDWWGVGKYSSIPDVVMLHYVKVVKGTCACR